MIIKTSLFIMVAVALLNMTNAAPGDERRIDPRMEGSISMDMQKLKQRITADILEGSLNEEIIQFRIASLQDDGRWPDIDYGDLAVGAFEHRRHLSFLLTLSRALKQADSPYRDRPELKQVILSALNFWLEHDFRSENWWWQKIGVPDGMLSVLFIMNQELTPEQKRQGIAIAARADLRSRWARPGGDLIKIAGIVAKRAVLESDEVLLQKAVKAMAGEVRIATGRGLQPDLSFHHRHDRVISTLTYGYNYPRSLVPWAVWLSGTQFSFPDSTIELMVDYYLDGISRSMAFGRYPDPGASNREMAKLSRFAPVSPGIPEDLLHVTSYRAEELLELVNVRKGHKQPESVWNKFFWCSEYHTHQRPTFFTSVRMHSSRGHNVEAAYTVEGYNRHHHADGSSFIILSGQEYLDIVPVFDWQHIPGATVARAPGITPENMNADSLSKVKGKMQRKGLNDFVGGVSDGVYGAAVFDFKSPHDQLAARKAWFFFDNEYVCLGAGISSAADYPVVTTLNQCLLHGKVIAGSADNAETLESGEHVLSDISYILHNEIAYLFPAPPSQIYLNNRTVQGRWSNISRNKGIKHYLARPDGSVEMEVFKLWLSHGKKPRGETYAYIVIPGMATTEMLEDYRNKNAVEIIANTPEIQAVRHNGLNLNQIVFYEAGECRLTETVSLKAESACLVLLRMHGDTVRSITVADPSRLLASVNLELTTRFEGQGKQWKAEWAEEKQVTKISIELPDAGYAGKSVTCANDRL